MSKTVSLKIDGRDIEVPEGTNLIDAAGAAGVHIPNLCYLKGMKGVGACRLCLVEIQGMKAPMISCTTKAKEGMVVNTKTEAIEELRKFVIDLILSMHPLDCMTCTKAGMCNLQKYAYDFELKESTFTRKKFGYPTDEANPFIKRDPDYCILCGRCVRVCKEQGTNVLDFMGRGIGAKVVTAMDKPLQESECTFCGSCVDACPVNALLEADRWRKGREWEYEKTNSVCLACGNGCDIIVNTKDNTIMKINSGAPEGSAEKYICAIGRFGFDSITSETRVTMPMKRVGNKLQETTWSDALKTVAEEIKKAGKNIGIISTAGVLNQDAFVLSKFASDVVKTKNIDTTVTLYADADSMKFSDSVNMDEADLFILAGFEPSQWERFLPALDAGIRKRLARGAKLIVINSEETKIADITTVNIISNEAEALAQIAKALISKGCKSPKEMESAIADVSITEEAEKIATLLLESKEPVIFTSPSLYNASVNIKLITHHSPASLPARRMAGGREAGRASLITPKVIAVPLEANARGVIAMGLTPEGKTYKEMVSDGLDVLYTIGEVPVTKKPKVDFLIAQTSFLTELAKQADIVLPSAAFLESKGTIINYLGKVKELAKAVEPPKTVKQHKDILIELSKMLGKPLKDSTANIKSAFEVNSKPKFNPFKKNKELNPKSRELFEKMILPVTTHSRLLWLKETEKAAAV